MATTSGPESRLSRGRGSLHLVGHEDSGRVSQAERRQVFALQMQGNGFAEVTSNFVESLALGNHGNLEAFGDVPRLLSGPDYGLDRVLKGHLISLLIALVPTDSMLTNSILMLKRPGPEHQPKVAHGPLAW